jgi:hypothetical protein
MARLEPVSWSWFEDCTPWASKDLYRGKHPYMVRGEIRIMIPNPHRQQVSVDLPRRILQQAEVTREEWEKVE